MENWKTIEGYEKYQVSDKGMVKSFKKSSEGEILKGGIDSDGYHIVLLYPDNGKRYTAKVHRLVAQAFIPNPECKVAVNHIDGVKTNNHVDNLEWNTNSENVKHAFDTGLKRSHYQDDSHKRPVAQIDLITKEVIKVYESATATKLDGFHRQSVYRVCQGNRPHHKGFGWKYI